jgi:hypothetical protein
LRRYLPDILMSNEVVNVIQTAVFAWARRTFATGEVAIGEVALDEEEGRYLVDLAARPAGYWLVVEVWLENGGVVAVNDLGEGLPLNGAEWPWPEEGPE